MELIILIILVWAIVHGIILEAEYKDFKDGKK